MALLTGALGVVWSTSHFDGAISAERAASVLAPDAAIADQALSGSSVIADGALTPGPGRDRGRKGTSGCGYLKYHTGQRNWSAGNRCIGQ
jgi:hypothetical protein